MEESPEPGPYVGMFSIREFEPTETFLKVQAARLPGRVEVVAGTPSLDGRPIMPSQSRRDWANRIARLTGGAPRTYFGDLAAAYATIIERRRFDVVLAQYGPCGVLALDGCRRAGTPLVVHFHGYDASRRSTIEQWREGYARLSGEAFAAVVVSKEMERSLLEIGFPPEKLRLNPYGIDTSLFLGSRPDQAAPTFLAVGRFVPKKSPDSTIRAFAKVHRAHPEARLRMIGGGELQPMCEELTRELGVADAVSFLGVRPHEAIRDEMKRARCVVQHSVVAPDGDSEGTPVALLEAGASGLPVVSTRHAGIVDAVVEGETGLLVDEHDVDGMADHMTRLVEAPDLAARLGEAARGRILREYSIETHIARLAAILAEAAAQGCPARA